MPSFCEAWKRLTSCFPEVMSKHLQMCQLSQLYDCLLANRRRKPFGGDMSYVSHLDWSCFLASGTLFLWGDNRQLWRDYCAIWASILFVSIFYRKFHFVRLKKNFSSEPSWIVDDFSLAHATLAVNVDWSLTGACSMLRLPSKPWPWSACAERSTTQQPLSASHRPVCC